ncbi:hypothetical protein G7046_g2008 [Stylonectria norvegica]|nr:hypothetical protein G7046_g2008 [Stylonectria norvegica]
MHLSLSIHPSFHSFLHHDQRQSKKTNKTRKPVHHSFINADNSPQTTKQLTFTSSTSSLRRNPRRGRLNRSRSPRPRRPHVHRYIDTSLLTPTFTQRPRPSSSYDPSIIVHIFFISSCSCSASVPLPLPLTTFHSPHQLSSTLPSSVAGSAMDPSAPSPGSTSRELKDTRNTSSTSISSAVSNTSANNAGASNNGGNGASSSHKPPALPQRTPSGSSINKSAHRQSFAENLRNTPSSPRSHRHPSFTQAAVQELLNHPPSAKHANPRFAGRDWRDVSVGELVSPDDIKWIERDSSIEEATMLLLKSPNNIVLVREDDTTQKAVSIFDYTDLNIYLLYVVGLAKPEEDLVEVFNDITAKAQQGVRIPLRDVQPLFRKESLVTLADSEKLAQTIQLLGGGIHRLLVTAENGDVIGIASQLRIVEFFWNEGINFPTIDRLYPVCLRDLGIGTKHIISVNSDAPLSDALTLMNNEGLTSVAVVDNGLNVVGNISTKDVRHLTSSSNAHLLNSSCMNFISVILNERGVEKGKDAFPVFYVNPYSTLAHTVAKLVATRSHRMWVVESASPSPSAPATPLMGPQSFASAPLPNAAPPSPVTASAVPASAMAGARISGRLSGVISLTDVLNLFAKSTGLNPTDPGEQRARRRRSSSSSVRPSLDSARASLDIRR